MDYNPLKGGLALISSLMFRKSRSLEDIICQYIDGFLISTISLFCLNQANFFYVKASIFSTQMKEHTNKFIKFYSE
jgi:hypothetical protein